MEVNFPTLLYYMEASGDDEMIRWMKAYERMNRFYAEIPWPVMNGKLDDWAKRDNKDADNGK